MYHQAASEFPEDNSVVGLTVENNSFNRVLQYKTLCGSSYLPLICCFDTSNPCIIITISFSSVLYIPEIGNWFPSQIHVTFKSSRKKVLAAQNLIFTGILYLQLLVCIQADCLWRTVSTIPQTLIYCIVLKRYESFRLDIHIICLLFIITFFLTYFMMLCLS
jgi:hypothetical protein